MSQWRTTGLGIVASVLLFFGISNKENPPPKPEPPARPSTPDDNRLRRPRRPARALVGAITVGGPVGPAGQQVACDLPVSQRLKNTGGMGPRGPGSGAGLCVFTSIEHAGRWQNVRPLIGLQEKSPWSPWCQFFFRPPAWAEKELTPMTHRPKNFLPKSLGS